MQHTRCRRGWSFRGGLAMVMCVTPMALMLACCSSPSPKATGLSPGRGVVSSASAQSPAGVPSVAEAIAAHNQRVADLSRLRTPVTMVIDAPDPSDDNPDRRRRDQLEGNLQLIQPANVSLRIDKVSQTLFVLGSNQQRYWWVEFTDPRRAFVGDMAQATPAKVARFGLALHPLDLLELAAITPLSPTARGGWDASRKDITQAGGVLRVRDRLISAAFASEASRSGGGSGSDGGWGWREVLFDPATLQPRAVWLLSPDGRAIAWSELDQYVEVPVDGKGQSPARIASRIRAVVWTERGEDRIEMSLSQPENAGNRIRTGQFDLDRVLDTYEVADVIDIDALIASEANQGQRSPNLSRFNLED